VIYTEELASSMMGHEIKDNSVHILNLKRENLVNLAIGEIEGTGFEASIKDSSRLCEIIRKKIGDDKESIFVKNFLDAGK
jgi:hypothetical protein